MFHWGPIFPHGDDKKIESHFPRSSIRAKSLYESAFKRNRNTSNLGESQKTWERLVNRCRTNLYPNAKCEIVSSQLDLDKIWTFPPDHIVSIHMGNKIA